MGSKNLNELPWSQWHPTKNVGLVPHDVSDGSEKQIFWICDLGHDWIATPYNRTRNKSGCPFCSNHKAWNGFNDLASKFPRLAAEWSSKNNYPPEEQVAGGNKSVWWECEKGHEWQVKVNVRVKQGANCPICANQKIVAGINDLEFLEPEIAKQWHPTRNGELLPSQVSVGSNKKAWWQCEKGHTWEAAISSRRRNGCPVCANFMVVAGVNDLATTHPEVALQWHPRRNGGLSPTQVALGQTKSIWWRCTEGHEWKATLDTRRVSGCPRCAKFGFSQDGDAEFYFIENQELRSWKVGITGTDREYDRIESYKKRSWTVIVRLPAIGSVARKAERAVLTWIREELGLTQFLDKSSMGRHGGASETFAIVEEKRDIIIAKMIQEIQLASEELAE